MKTREELNELKKDLEKLGIIYNPMTREEKIQFFMTVIYLALIGISLGSLICAIVTGEISMQTIKFW